MAKRKQKRIRGGDSVKVTIEGHACESKVLRVTNGEAMLKTPFKMIMRSNPLNEFFYTAHSVKDLVKT